MTMAIIIPQSASYFSHDADMRNDIKIKALRRAYGLTGYAVWCMLLETLTDADQYTLEYDEVTQELLAADFDITAEELTGIIALCVRLKLLQLTDNRLSSLSLTKRFATLTERREIRAERARKAANARWGQSNATAMQEQCNGNANAMLSDAIIEESKGEESKVNESKRDERMIVSIDTSNNATTNKERGVERLSPPYDLLRVVWNDICGGRLPIVKQVTEKRKIAVRARLADMGLETRDEILTWMTGACNRIIASPFLRGENNRQWQASFDWLFERKDSWVRLSEGVYDDKTPINHAQTAQQLGVGEFIKPDGTRSYGSGRAVIPLSAPPRPSEAYTWDADSQTWINL